MRISVGKAWSVLALLALWAWPGPAEGQGRKGQGQGRATQPARPSDEGGQRARRRGDGNSERQAEDVARRLFGVEPEDQGPLQPGEEEELLEFAREHMPRLARAMQWVHDRNPERFRERMAQYAPRLRHLRRIYAENPRVGDVVRQYAENLVEIERGVRNVRGAPTSSPSFQRDVQSIRGLVARNVGLEGDALEALASEMDSHRGERIELRVAYVTGADADLAASPPALRELVAAYQAATTDADRSAQRDAVRAEVARQIGVEIDALRERVARIRQHAGEEVDRRMERLLDKRGPGGGKGPAGGKG